MTVKAISTNLATILGQKLSDFAMLIKFRLTSLVVLSAVFGFLAAYEGTETWKALSVLILGGFCITAAANSLNQVLEKDFDKLMRRTANRPLATGRMTVSEAVITAGVLCVLGIMLLALFNPIAAVLGSISVVLYAFVYTPMKRISPAAVLIGAIPGALPTMIGVVAASGHLTSLALSLFAIQFLWQFPHFWAIGWLGFEDYQKAGFKFLPANGDQPDRSIATQAFIYALLLIPVSLFPVWIGVNNWFFGGIVLLFTLFYAYTAWGMYQHGTRRSALIVMFTSFFYLPLVLIAIWIGTYYI